MKNKFLRILTVLILFLTKQFNFAQAPSMGSTSNYVLFSTNGSLANTGTSFLTGDVGTNNGTCTNFSSLIGTVHIMDAASSLCASDLGLLYTQLNATTSVLIPTTTLGNGQVITAGAYSLSAASSLNGTLTLNAQSNANAFFIIKVQGAFTANTGAVVALINGAQACNVFWQIEGLITLNAGTIMKGTMIANNAAISIAAGVNLEGRALSTTGAVAIDGSVAFTPTSCGVATTSIITQPTSQTLCTGSAAVFSVVASGTSLTYQWRIGTTNLVNGGNISGATSAILTINPATSVDVASNYNVVVTGLASSSVISTNVVLVINSSPTITSMASNQTLCAGSPLSFSVAATGSGLTYQWRNGTTNLINGGTTTGVNTANLLISAVNFTDVSNNYNVVVAGLCAPSVTSANVTLGVNTLPSITSMASNQTLCAGSLLSFSVSAIGNGLTYQWRNGTTNLINAGTISGANTSNLLISAVNFTDASNNYNVVVSGLCAPSATSANVTLVVNTSPTITSIASNQTLCAGSALSFSVAATGSGLTYQWRNGTMNLINGGTTTGVNTANLLISAVNFTDVSNNYNVVVSGLCAPSVTSANVVLGVNALPLITSMASNQTMCVGSPLSFSVTATGNGLSYQWRNGTTNLINGGTTTGVNTAILLISAVNFTDASNNYNVVVSGLCAPSVTSANVILVVNTSPSITSIAANQTLCAGSALSFSVAATGSGLTYQWRNGTTNLINGGTTTGVNTTNLLISAVNFTDVSNNYNVVVSGLCVPSVTSANVVLGVNALPTITSIATNQTLCAGSALSFSVAATGSGLTYQWRNGTTNLVNGGTMTGANTSNLLISAVNFTDASNNYNVVVSGLCAPSATSANVTLVVNSSPTITSIASNQTLCAGSPLSFSVTATGSGLTYQWRIGTTNLINAGTITGANTSNLLISAVNFTNASNNYNVVISGLCAPSVTSANVVLVVNTSASITSIAANQTLCAGSVLNFSVAATGSGLTYQWRNGTTNLINVGTISGANTSNLLISAVNFTNASNNYNVVVSGLCAPSVTSANVVLVVNTSPSITSIAVNQTLCAGSPLSFSVAAIGNGLTFQWRNGTTNLINAGTISGANTSNLLISAVNFTDASNNYNVVVSGLCAPSVTSANVVLVVNTSPSITSIAANQTLCAGSALNFSVAATGNGLTYQWRNGTTNLINGGTIVGANTSNLLISAVNFTDASNNYNVVVSGLCAPSVTSTNVVLVVNTSPSITSIASNQTLCAGSPLSFSVSAIGSGLTYQWRNGTTNLIIGGTIVGANTSNLLISAVNFTDASNNYNIVVSGLCAPSVTSTNIVLVVNSSPVIVTSPLSQTLCEGSPLSFSVAAIGNGLTYQWRNGTTNLVNGGTITGANTSNLLISAVNFTDASNNYNVVISGLCAPSVTSANVVLVVETAPHIIKQPVNQMAYLGGSINFSVLATGSGLTYQWRKGNVNLQNGGNISGVNSRILSINPVTATDTSTTYNVLVSGNCGTADTSLYVTLWVCDCIKTAIAKHEKKVKDDSVIIYPNPFNSSLNIEINGASTLENCEFKLYSLAGSEVFSMMLTKQTSIIETNNLMPGVYVYKIVSKNIVIQSGKLISQQ